MRNPSFQFYPADWRNDERLQLCSLAARGLWIELMGLMHVSERYGFLSRDGRPMTATEIATLVRARDIDVTVCMDELLRAGVPSVGDNGVWFSRRMLRDQRQRRQWQKRQQDKRLRDKTSLGGHAVVTPLSRRSSSSSSSP